MNMQARHLKYEALLYAVCASKSAIQGGIVRGAVRDVERLIGRRAFEVEVKRRGYHMIENAGQLFIFCNNRAFT
jgi:hypothetical protein